MRARESKQSRIKKANKFLLSTLMQAAWGAVRTQGSIFQRKYHRWQKRMGRSKALIAICHALLEVAYEVLKQDRPYIEPDANQLEEQERNRRVRHHTNALRKLGADENMIQELAERLSEEAEVIPHQQWTAAADEVASEELETETVDDGTEQEATPVPETKPGARQKAPKPRIQSPVARRGALGFRARQARIQTRSNVKDRPQHGNASAKGLRASHGKP